MKKITKLRIFAVLLLTIITLIGGLISYILTPESLPLIIIICLVIEASLKWVDKYIIAPALKDFDDKEKAKRKQSKEIVEIRSKTKKQEPVKNLRIKALQLLKKIENIDNKVSHILPEYLELLIDLNEVEEKIWVNIEIGGTIHENKKKFETLLSYRNILGYISTSRITSQGRHTIESIKRQYPNRFLEHTWMADYTIQELEEMDIGERERIVVGHYSREGLECYNYASVASIKLILGNIRKKMSSFLIEYINK
jgi:hypothetical protein